VNKINLNPQEVTLTKSELQLINYMYAHIDDMPFISITQLAKSLTISSATLSRGVRHLGFASFKDLKEWIAKENRISPAYKMEQALHHTPNRYNQLLIDEMQHMNETMKHMNEEAFAQALESISNAETLHLFGKGAAYGLAHLLAFRFNRFQKNTRIMESSGSSLFESLHLVKANDLILLFAFDKMPLEAQLLLEHQKKVGYTTLVITDRLYSNQTLQGHIQLYVCRGDKNSYHSMVAPMAMVDNLVVEYAKAYQPMTLTSLNELFSLKESYANQLPR